MSDNKLKYWEVTTTQIVKANSKNDAMKLVGRRGRTAHGEVLSVDTNIDRISAADAHEIVYQVS
jgi:hypothetical protein